MKIHQMSVTEAPDCVQGSVDGLTSTEAPRRLTGRHIPGHWARYGGRIRELGKLAELAQTAGDSVSPLRIELAHLSRWDGTAATHWQRMNQGI